MLPVGVLPAENLSARPADAHHLGVGQDGTPFAPPDGTAKIYPLEESPMTVETEAVTVYTSPT